MKQLFINKVLLIAILILTAPVCAVADIGGTPSLAGARQSYEDYLDGAIHEAIARGLVRISRFDKSDGLSSELYGTKMYAMEVEIELEFLKNVAVCSGAFVGEPMVVKIVPEAEISRLKNQPCSAKIYREGGRLAEKGSIEYVKYENGWRIKTSAFHIKPRDATIDAALLKAVMDGKLDVVKALIRKGADINAKSEGAYSSSSLAIAVGQGKTEIVKVLLDNGADANGNDSQGERLLVAAVKNGNINIIKNLLDKGADVNARDSYCQSVCDTILLKAANIDVKNIQVYNLLLDRGADVNAKGRNNATALMYAAKSGNIELVKLLLDREADINAKDGDTVTALMYAANSGNIELVKMLLDKGADINARIVSNDVKSNGLTALRIASAKGNAEIVKLLKEKGAVENTENRITVGDSAAPQPKQMNSMYVLAMINRAKMYCFTCHSINKRVVGPAWRDVAAKYRGVTDANARLVAKVSQGGSGVWGTMPMPPNAPKVPEQDIKLLVQFILNL